MPKIIRDIAILITFCGAFLLLLFFVRGDSTKAATSSNFSTDRLEGDRMLKERNWQQAIVHFKKLVEKDKYNGLAQMSLSKASIYKLHEDASLFAEKQQAKDYSEDEMKRVSGRLRAQAIDSIEIQKMLLRFPKYEDDACRNLAALNCFIGDQDEAMKYLKRYARSGSYNIGYIRADPRFSSLKERGDFKELTQEDSDLPIYERGIRGRRRPW